MASLLKSFIQGDDKKVLDKVPPTIFQSWNRCREQNINHERIVQDDILQSCSLKELLGANENLIIASKPILQHIFCLLRRNHYQIMLSNSEGFILETLGEPSFISRTEKIFLTPGVNWREDLKGTNGIGTVLVEEAPLAIPGWTHYSTPVSFLDCWASPIRDINNNLVGVLNISGEAGARHRQLMDIAILGASMIEQNFQIIEMKTRLTLSKSKMDNLGKMLIDGYVPFDNSDIQILEKNTFLVPISLMKKNLMECEKNPWYGRSLASRSVLDIALRAARTDSTVLVQGESGTGKEIIARTIHSSSSRKEKPFVTLNCAAIPNNLVESELFGYVEGAFTGAKRGGQPGKFELASGGTIFLDEIGDMPFQVQASLLRVLQQKEFYRVGDGKCRVMNARVIAATNQDLRQLVEQGKFRLDLYYRLKVIFIEIPPLRERSEDIWDLAPYFVAKYCNKFDRPSIDISPELFHHLINYEWPGNVRQLENCIENMVALWTGGLTLNIEDLPEEFKSKPHPLIDSLENELALHTAVLERRRILQALQDTNGNLAAAARNLGIGRTTIYRKMNKLGIVFP